MDDECLGLDIVEPDQWHPADDRRVPVLDENVSPPRVVRYVGWRSCMKCSEQFFSRDIAGVRMCPPCKAPTLRENW
jgi:hypothetical protein